MKETMYVIATRGRGNKEIYLAYDEECSSQYLYKCFIKWTSNIDEAMAMFTYTDIEQVAKKHFKGFNKWYIKEYQVVFK